MFKNLDLFRMAHSMAVHAGTRQALIAQNIANADTPGYSARDLVPFHQTYRGEAAPAGMKSTRAAHFLGGESTPFRLQEATQGGGDELNRNNVSVEDELLNAVAAKRQHDRALAIYKSALTIMRSSLGRN